MTQTLADLSQSLFANLGVPGAENTLNLTKNEFQAECLLLIDGLGMNAIEEFSANTKFIKELEFVMKLAATFPSTTATSLTSLGTGMSAGEHGMVGYTMRVPNSGSPERVLNALKWDERVDPVIWQPHQTFFERASNLGIKTTHVAGKRYAESGFTRAALRGAQYLGANNLDELSEGARKSLDRPKSFSYVYVNDVDDASHGSGFGSEKFRLALDKVDQLIGLLMSRLPKGSRLWVTSDHGMINRGKFVVVGKENNLLEEVELMAGEPRVRYLYLKQDAIERVRSRWLESLGDQVLLLTREEAISQGLFGGKVAENVAERIGDLIAIANGDFIMVERERETAQLAMVGHHGGITKPEVEIPLMLFSK